MVKANENFSKLKESYLFIEISGRINEFIKNNPDKPLIKMGIGDVTLPLAPAVTEAMKKASDEMGKAETFRGYEDSGRGYLFLRESVSGYYADIGVDLDPDEILISDGAKSDCGNLSDIFSSDNTVLVTDPVYPVYYDSNLMGGRNIVLMDSNEQNGFAAMPDYGVKSDIIYLCSPNNPTGSVYTKEQLQAWVDYANKTEAIIIFDAAYEAFIQDPELPRSIYQIEGARSCAIEISSLSKTAGFTGTRCGYTVVPKDIELSLNDGGKTSAYKLWCRRQSTKFNGVSYPVQRAAEAVFTKEGQAQVKKTIGYYQNNAKIITECFDKLRINYTGGKNSPYIWFKCPKNMSSWDFFDYMLKTIQVVGTPGQGFGKNGEGWFRLTSFNTSENTAEAMNRFEKMFYEMFQSS
ncbi:MAG: LL-diaminopimelate aminotransferase [Eubacterium sp.]|jgi:LL-diaminopimelate aminotransferase|nr:LL-diaminopimelate aminotransferase [Eubacterium sp.]